MERPSPHTLLLAMGTIAKGKNVLESLVSTTKCSSLDVTRITAAPNSLVKIAT